MTRTVHVVTDSACDLPEDLVQAHDIRIVPLSIRFGDEEFVDRRDLTSEQFWAKTQSASELPSTAAPSPGAFEEAFRAAAADGATGVVCVNLSSKLSATYQAAVAAAAAVKGDIEVEVIDSALCTVAQGSIVLEASRLAAAGSDLATVTWGARDLQARTSIYGALDTLDNLKKGGRIGAAGAFFASLLSVKPIISIVNGEVEPESRQRTRTRALNHLADLVKQAEPVTHVAVSHSGAPDLEQFLELIAPVAPRAEVMVADIGPVIGSHGGPGLIAVSFAKGSPAAG